MTEHRERESDAAPPRSDADPAQARSHADPEEMADHWWWRPGWQVGTRFYALHLTLEHQVPLHGLIDAYVGALDDASTLDPIPPRWRHLTVQGLGHVPDVDDARLRSAIVGIARELAALEPIRADFRRAAILREAVALPPSDPEPFIDLRDALRRGITAAWGSCLDRADGFRPHVSVAYSTATARADPIRSALDGVEPLEPVVAIFDAVSVIRMHRDRRMYEWETVERIPLGTSG